MSHTNWRSQDPVYAWRERFDVVDAKSQHAIRFGVVPVSMREAVEVHGSKRWEKCIPPKLF